MADDVIERVAAAICNAFEAYAPVPAVLRTEAPQIARALAEAGLLADPDQQAHIDRLTLALDAARVPHEAPYVDGEHQGGNCIDVIMNEKAAAHQLACENVDLQVRVSELTSELERLRTRVAAQENINQGWQEYKHRKKVERERRIEAFEDALGLPHEGRGFWYERMIDAAAKVRDERDRLRDRNRATIAKCDDVLATSQNEFERAVAFVVRGILEDDEP